MSVVHDLMLVTFKFQELGLLPGTPVGTSLIDAHAGGVGVMESIPDAGSKAGCQWWVILCFAREIAFKTLCMLYIF
jgi:ribulose kinase